MKKISPLFVFLLLFLAAINIIAQENSLKDKIKKIINGYDAKVGVAVINLDNGDTLTVNDSRCYPMQSVYKFPLALTVLNRVDKGELSLDQKIHVKESDLLPDTWSPLREKYPGGNVTIPLSEIVEYTVAQSDNNGCDILFRLIGGPSVADDYIKELGIEGMNILYTEEEMHADDRVQYKNCGHPSSMTELLAKFYYGRLLSPESQNFLWETMSLNVFGKDRIMGLLPEGTLVAHKTGSSGMLESGIAPATNDAGIIVTTDGKVFAITVFVSDSYEDEKTRKKIIAEISKAVWDEYTPKAE